MQWTRREDRNANALRRNMWGRRGRKGEKGGGEQVKAPVSINVVLAPPAQPPLQDRALDLPLQPPHRPPPPNRHRLPQRQIKHLLHPLPPQRADLGILGSHPLRHRRALRVAHRRVPLCSNQSYGGGVFAEVDLGRDEDDGDAFAEVSDFGPPLLSPYQLLPPS